MNRKLLTFCLLSLFIFSCSKEKLKESLLKQKDQSELKSSQQIMGENIETSGTYYMDGINGASLIDEGKDTFDLYVPHSTEPVPLIIAFHGGGFVYGHRKLMYPANFNTAYNQGGVLPPWITIANLDNRKIAYAAVSYTFCNSTNKSIVNSLEDCQSVIDYFINNATQYNINPNKIILMGQSAGASASLWIGLRNIYPSIKGIVCFDPQASLNLNEWESNIFHAPSLQVYCQQQIYSLEASGYKGKLYSGINPDTIPDLSLMNLFDPTDPEVYLVSTNTSSWASGDFLHHDRHIHRLITKSKANGHDKMKFIYDFSQAYFGYGPSSPETIINFCYRVCQ